MDLAQHAGFDDAARRVGESHEVEFRLHEVALLGGELELAGGAGEQADLEGLAVVGRGQGHREGGGHTLQLVGDESGGAAGGRSVAVTDQQGRPLIRRREGVGAARLAVLTGGGAGSDLDQGNLGGGVEYALVGVEADAVGDGGGVRRGGGYGGGFVHRHQQLAAGTGLAEEQAVEDAALDAADLGLALDLAGAPRHRFGELVLTVQFLVGEVDVDGHRLEGTELHRGGVGNAGGRAEQDAGTE